MKKTILRLLVAAVFIIAGCAWLDSGKTNAAPQTTFGQPACVSYVPLGWGDFKAGSQATGVVFQDSKGNLRFITSFPCEGTPLIALEIRRANPNPN